MEELKIKISEVSSLTGGDRDTHLEEIRNIIKTQSANEEIVAYLVTSNIIVHVTKAIKEHTDWLLNPPHYIYSIVYFTYSIPYVKVPHEQSVAFVEAVLEKLDKCESHCRLWFDLLRVVTSHQCVEFLSYEPLYVILKKFVSHASQPIQLNAISVFCTLTHSNMEWRQKLLEDKELTTAIIGLSSVLSGKYTFWALFVNLAQHQSAKSLLAAETIPLTLGIDNELSKDIYAILSSESIADNSKVNPAYVSDRASKLKRLISQRLVPTEMAQDIPEFDLLDLVYPLSNLSIEEANIALLTECGVTEMFLEILQIDDSTPLIHQVANLLPISKLRASKGLWNLAMHENPRPIINANGVEVLNNLLAKIPEIDKMAAYRNNIKGILFSLTNEFPQPVETKKHIMISYNLGSKPMVRKLVTELQKHGYQLWFEKGKSPETVVHAISESYLVLMCMSQRYKDAPNCKFEAQYAAKRNIRLIPLIMQPNYNPEGWLRTLTQRETVYNFSDESELESNLPRLLEVLGDSCKAEVSTANGSSHTLSPSSHPSTPRPLSPRPIPNPTLRLSSSSAPSPIIFSTFNTSWLPPLPIPPQLANKK